MSIDELNNTQGSSENIALNPLFIVQEPNSKNNFSLQEKSPAIDLGLVLRQQQDILDNRISGTKPDLGAFETLKVDRPASPDKLRVIE